MDSFYRTGSQTDAQTNFYIFVKSETPLSLVLGGIRTYSLLIFGLTTPNQPIITFPGIGHTIQVCRQLERLRHKNVHQVPTTAGLAEPT